MAAQTKQPLDPEAEIMTLREVAKYLRISISTVHRLVERGELHAFRAGDSRVRRKTLEEWMRQRAAMTQGKRK
jgi:excisionase family DNA binding protein